MIIVIGLLVVVAGIFSLNMIKVMNKNKADEIKNVEKQLISAADAYVTMDPSSIQKLYDGFSFVEIEVKTLRKYGLINDDLKDPETGKPISDEKKIRVSVGQNGELVFEYDPNTDIEGWDLYVPDLNLTIGEQTEYTDEDALSDLRTKVVLINSDYQTPKEEYYQGITIEYNNVNVNRVGQYRITYKFYDPSMNIYKMKDRRVFVKLPPEVEYTVNYYFMNPDGVTYTKNEEYTKKGKASYGTSITPERIEIIGFITPDSQSIVLSQTSNTIDYYYDRESYNVTIDPNGGVYNKSTEPTTVKVYYGNSYNLLNPTREEYEFMGWYTNTDMTGGTPVTSATLYRQNGKTLYARWYKSFTVTASNRGMVGYTDTITELEIPSTFVNGGEWYKVIGAGYEAFRNCDNLTSVIIPEGVITIGGYVFYACDNLTSVAIPNSVIDLGWGTFQSCPKLTSLTIPNNVTYIGDRTFYGCSNLTSITIPDTVKSIGNWAFKGCKSLTSVIIPDNVTSIGEEAFSQCSSLTSVTIGNKVTTIGKSAFYGCSLTSITIPDSVTSIGKKVFHNCDRLTSINVNSNNLSYKSIDGVLFSHDLKTLIKYPPRKSEEDYDILNDVINIEEYAFYKCRYLISVTIPDSVISIGDYSFSNGSRFDTGYSKLTSVTIGNGVKTIGNYAFENCGKLASINIPSNVTSIGNSAFYYCYNLTSINIPSSVTSIGSSAFYDCYNLASINIPSSVTSIGNEAFYGVPHIQYSGTATGSPWGAKSIN